MSYSRSKVGLRVSIFEEKDGREGSWLVRQKKNEGLGCDRKGFKKNKKVQEEKRVVCVGREKMLR